MSTTSAKSLRVITGGRVGDVTHAVGFGEASVRLFEQMEVTAATSVTRMVSDKLASMDPTSLGDCM